MSDGALDLLAAMQAALAAGCPLAGGWHSDPRPGGTYPYGTFYVTRSLRQAGNAWRHWGIVNVWSRNEAGDPAARAVRDAYTLSGRALEAVDGGFPTGALLLHDIVANDPARQLQPDGTWRGFFTFVALTS